ncbi:Sugar or nucleoside kinase, ribokinase family [Tsukamurella pulmonis]|uniref:Sugar or nucleoside kinase, ribokinase family n=1 Tax=Tsukamurella pulmonis TaxID=47312 RepID=A0A1H1C6Z7_9ACTN|nr:PfkB family carbohydrate kinase [Tsukamurella pulmonis]SDQ59921.1 Sugar or nucleoside kinase, ribokinase family [Tsukamurella pulmonis]SUP24133.1 ribokinase [Tsukamurella pulmonis]
MGRSGPRGLFVGLATVDVLSRVAETPPRNGKVTAVRQDVAGGGPALNAAAVFAALGGRAVLAAPVGESALGRVVHEDLAVCGVELIDLAPPGFAPPVSSVTVHAPSGDRQVVSFDGSGYPDAVPPIRADDVDVVLLDGHGPAAARAAIRSAVTAGVPTVLDAGRWRPVFAELLPLATHAVCSADFALPDSVQRPAVFAVTDGAGPIRYHDHGAVGTVEVPPVPVVDTLGAGDVLHGAYALAIARGESVRDALRFAAGHASAKCRYPGVRAWLETL